VQPDWQRAIDGGDALSVHALLEAGADPDALDR
jgi:hypothetical protein